MGIRVVDSDELNKIIIDLNYTQPDLKKYDLKYDSNPIPYTSDGTYYLPISVKDMSEIGNIKAVNGYEVLSTIDLKKLNFSRIISDGARFTLYVCSDDEYSEIGIVFTQLPMFSITTLDNVDDATDPITEDDTRTRVSFYDPCDATTECVRYIESNAMMHIRGATSRVFPKKSYKLEFENDKWEKKNYKLMDFRKDDDWILYAIYQEETKIRDKLCADLWSEIGGYYGTDTIDGCLYNGTRLEYVEVIINGEYWGMYGLMEPIDEKQLGLTEDDLLIKTIGDQIPTESEVNAAIKNGSSVCKLYEIKYPEDKNTYSSVWTRFSGYINTVYNSDAETFTTNIENVMDIEYTLDYMIYVQVIGMGCLKNTYHVMRADGKSYAIPWDNDISFGLNWAADAPRYHVHYPEYITQIYDYRPGVLLLEYDVNGSVNYFKERYAELRKDVLDKEKLLSQVDELFGYISNSGAYARNLNRWSETGTADIEYLKDCISQRIDFLDLYVANLK